jgi:predicted lipase
MCKDVYAHEKDWLVEEKEDAVFIAIEGTDCASDWKTNLSFLFRSDDTHDGFKRNAWRVFFEMFEQDVFRGIPKDKAIFVCGHSLGGATATVLGDILDNVFSNVTIVTFGSPRPGGRVLRERLKNTPVFRFVHGSDVVPSTPPWTAGYVHVSEKIHLADTKEELFDGVKDHSMTEYIKAVNSL